MKTYRYHWKQLSPCPTPWRCPKERRAVRVRSDLFTRSSWSLAQINGSITIIKIEIICWTGQLQHFIFLSLFHLFLSLAPWENRHYKFAQHGTPKHEYHFASLLPRTLLRKCLGITQKLLEATWSGQSPSLIQFSRYHCELSHMQLQMSCRSLITLTQSLKYSDPKLPRCMKSNQWRKKRWEL